MSVRFEITTEPDTVAPGDLVVLRLVTQKGGVKHRAAAPCVASPTMKTNPQ